MSSRVEVCRGLSCVELSSLTLDRPAHGVRGFLSRSVEVCRAILSSSLSSSCQVSCRVVEARAQASEEKKVSSATKSEAYNAVLWGREMQGLGVQWRATVTGECSL